MFIKKVFIWILSKPNVIVYEKKNTCNIYKYIIHMCIIIYEPRIQFSYLGIRFVIVYNIANYLKTNFCSDLVIILYKVY